MAEKFHIVVPAYLIQFLVEPIFEAQERTSDDTTGGSAQLDMYAEVLEVIEKSGYDVKSHRRKWVDIQLLGKEYDEDGNPITR